MIKFLWMGLFILMSCITQAQQFLFSGKITFERKFNVIKDLEDQQEESADEGSEGENSWFAEMKKNMPKHRVDIFQLNFTTKNSLYKVVKEDEHPMLNWFKTVSDLSRLNYYQQDSFIENRSVYDKTFLIGDTLMKPEWKITGEYREIAGYSCRRATTVIHDSIYVIAFYTDAIPISGGPDMYAGLPGMILGVVVPRFNFTIFATNVESATPTPEELTFQPNKRAKVLRRSDVRTELLKNTQDWGDYANRFILKALF